MTTYNSKDAPRASREREAGDRKALLGEPLARVQLASSIPLARGKGVDKYVDVFDATDGHALTLRPDGIVTIATADGRDVFFVHASRVEHMSPLAVDEGAAPTEAS